MALIPPFFLDTVLAIGVADGNGSIRWIASAFLYGHHIGKQSKDGQIPFRVFVVTNKHVIGNHRTLYVRVNPVEEHQEAKGYKLPLYDDKFPDKPLWTGHTDKNVDVAIVPINFNLLHADNMQVAFFKDTTDCLDTKGMQSNGLSEGDGCYMLGFPMGLVGNQRNTVIVRSGVIARIRETFQKSNNRALVDGLVFPGNSGGPVVLKPEVVAIEGTKAIGSASLVGIVSGYLPYSDTAISIQTGKPRITFEENSGLTAIYTVDCIRQTIKRHLRLKKSEQSTPMRSSKADERLNETRT